MIFLNLRLSVTKRPSRNFLQETLFSQQYRQSCRKATDSYHNENDEPQSHEQGIAEAYAVLSSAPFGCQMQ